MPKAPRVTPLEAHIGVLGALAGGRAEPAALAGLMRGGADPGSRALVYRNSGYRATREALAANHPALAAIMGETFFGAMARAYADAHPPGKRTLVTYGENLPVFLDAEASGHGMPWLIDLARLDRAWLCAHLAAELAPLSPERLAALAADPRALARTPLGLVASARLVVTRWTAYALWSDLRRGLTPEAPRALEDKADRVLIWRGADGAVVHRALGVGEHAFLAALNGGGTLGAAAEAACAADPPFDPGAALGGGVAGGVFAAADPVGGACRS